MYHTYEETFGQHESLKRTFAYVIGQEDRLRAAFSGWAPQEIVFLGCGSSYWGALAAHVTMEAATGIKSYAVTSGDVVLNSEFYQQAYKKPLIIAPSRSGSTSETVRAINFLKEEYGCPVLTVVEYADSPLEALADVSLFLPWCNETGVCQTRSFNNLYMVSLLLAGIFGGDRGLIDEVGRYVNEAQAAIERTRPAIEAFVNAQANWTNVVALGSGSQFGIACEGALILIEVAQVPASYYMTLELRHGPMVMVGGDTAVFLFSGTKDASLRKLEEDLARDCRGKQAAVVALCDVAPFAGADVVFELGYPARSEIVALFGSYVMQGMAYYKAVKNGVNPDAPAGLSPLIRIGQN
ncbi:MAG: SIS domain-containing protein [Paenibacillaceae bacterium]|nr:SIS domain-containing protein [Paenibacillaceae bacterium]